MSDIWLPGQGVIGTDERAAAKAVEEYDSDLMLGQDRRTGDYVVLLKNGPHGVPFPVLGLGSRLMGPDEIKKKLYESDVRRHGAKIAADIERRNEAKLEELRLRADEGTEAAAEAYDWAFRKLGAHPFPRIFVPGGK